ncbi:tRNA (adenosine(37)-N6)-threonylcarbamoyltransferase complex transferase subunit TsaD [Elstera cyanobacteriorum]|uniref:tRNA (adenosine(37)-N6)-threonylcarbamoyltransferase complex transferase subunit TsaD n=1 Tax=Elstera cyanobacteriorum TaxID=2022747 RepID=UPI002352F8A8|nr:tRNA (adenosine(37)-N6)-threonylcarbamoyltransferase complex transferase subunit TsaD [Elstera cyanobacteriorum]MCK6441391.1 tRNA (adenosine(37)-N6)-threonylcarbamoyltransferase complex transferase subunit TsaD [Elstera cyanobacteriorum]
MRLVLGIESSCDETAAAVVAEDRRILSNIVLSQLEDHRAYGGVVPEIAARAHLDHIERVVSEAMATAGVGFADLAGVAATTGPGLIGGVIVGATVGKSVALVHDKPFIAINHLEGHALTCRLTDDVPFPFLLLLVSGGHSQFLSVTGVGQYRRLGGTIDDAVGEAFDKTAKMLGLGFPGGPAVEQAALSGDAARFALPRPLLGRPGTDLSLSGLKTAVRLAAEKLPAPVSAQDLSDLAASFQAAVGDLLADRLKHALADFLAEHPNGKHVVIAGGVAANKALRARLQTTVATAGLELVAPPLKLCTDNGAMIAWAGLERLRRGESHGFDAPCRPRWPLDAAA